MDRTLPRKRGADPANNRELLLAERYGTLEMGRIWGANRTFEYSLLAQGMAAKTLSDMYPDIVPPEHAAEIMEKANLSHVSPDRIRAIEEKKKHDVIAINTSLEEVLSEDSAAHINKGRTSADTTETAKGLQLKNSIEVIIDSLENLRDVMLERAYLDWGNVPHMDCTHGYDALPTVAGRPFAFYAELLQFSIDELETAMDYSVYGKWADATGNHHSATALGIDGVALQQRYCSSLGLKSMLAPAQVPGREFIFNVVSRMAMAAGTMQGIAEYIREGRKQDVGLFTYPKGAKGSSAMPHKDLVGGNPSAEEQVGSYFAYAQGVLMTSMATIPFSYARDLEGSASDRITLEGLFKFGDHTIRRLAEVLSNLKLDVERSKERVERTFGVTTSQQVMTYLTDRRKVASPMPRRVAHDLTAKLATDAYTSKRQFYDVCLENEAVRSMLDEATLRTITNPLDYIGESRNILRMTYECLHGKKSRK
jgi:adenylosuccinate lyase